MRLASGSKSIKIFGFHFFLILPPLFASNVSLPRKANEKRQFFSLGFASRSFIFASFFPVSLVNEKIAKKLSFPLQIFKFHSKRKITKVFCFLFSHLLQSRKITVKNSVAW